MMTPAQRAIYQLRVNAWALAYAQKQASARRNCIRVIPPTHPSWMCLGTMLDPNLSRYTLAGTYASFQANWSIGSGTLPPGVTLDDLGHNMSGQAIAELAGQPTTPGKYNFTVQASTSMGLISLRDTLSVFGLPNLSLPDATVGTLYTEQLTAAGGTDPVTFTAPTPTALPPGLTLASDGKITGTPTAGGNFSFNVSMKDAEGGVCVEKVTINVPGGPFGNLLLNLACPVCTVGGPFIILGDTYFAATQTAADALALAAGNAILAANCVPIGGPTEIGTLVWTVGFCCGPTTGSMAGGSGTFVLGGSGNNAVGFNAAWCSPWPAYNATITIVYTGALDTVEGYMDNGVDPVSSNNGPSPVIITGLIRPGPNSIFMQMISIPAGSGTITITPLIH